MTRTLALALLCSVALSAPASAANTTPQEAQRLLQVFQTYLSPKPGVVTVTPQGSSYEVRLDPGPLLDLITLPELELKFSPIAFGLEPLGGGRWHVTHTGAHEVKAEIANNMAVAVKFGRWHFDGEFDEALMSFTRSEIEVTDFSLVEAIKVPGANGAVSQTTAKMTSSLKGVSGTADALSMTTTSEQLETVGAYDVPFPGPDSRRIVSLKLAYRIGRATTESQVTGLRNRAMYGLWAWLVAHPSAGEITAAQEEFRQKVRAFLPIFENITGSGRYYDIQVDTQVGPFSVKEMTTAVSLTTSGPAGGIAERFSLTGLSLPQGALPNWAGVLVPHDATVDFVATGLDVAAMAAVAVDHFNLTESPPLKPELEPQLMGALLPAQTLNITLKPTSFINALYALNLSGIMKGTPGRGGEGHAEISLKGIDAVTAALAAAPPEARMGQAVRMLSFARTLAKPGADGALTWVIDAAPTAGVKVNGVVVIPPH